MLKDVIASQVLPVVRLTEIFRQAGQSWIVRAAHQVNHGELPESAPDRDGDFYFIEADEPEAIIERIITMVRERVPARFGLDPLRDVQVLAPMNRSELGARNLNQRLQAVLNAPRGGNAIERFGNTFHVGDKVLQTVNNYQKEVFNGDIGRVTAVDRDEQEMTVVFDAREVSYDFGELDELNLAFAMTIHKAQGSEYAAVILPLHTQHYMMLQRNLLYTGITRGKRLVVIVGSRKALSMAVQRQDTAQRRLHGIARGGCGRFTARGTWVACGPVSNRPCFNFVATSPIFPISPLRRRPSCRAVRADFLTPHRHNACALRLRPPG